jgi:hypothetical protein
MRFIRRLHLYLGCFFAPLLFFYLATGWYQTLHPDRRKNLGEADDWIARFRSVHVDQIYPAASAGSYSPTLFRALIVLMSLALIITLILGIILAFRSLRNRWPVWLSLGLGILVPVVLLWLGQHR